MTVVNNFVNFKHLEENESKPPFLCRVGYASFFAIAISASTLNLQKIVE